MVGEGRGKDEDSRWDGGRPVKVMVDDYVFFLLVGRQLRCMNIGVVCVICIFLVLFGFGQEGVQTRASVYGWIGGGGKCLVLLDGAG